MRSDGCRRPARTVRAGLGLTGSHYFAETLGCGFRVANQPSLSLQAELVENLTSIVDTFSGRAARAAQMQAASPTGRHR